MDKCLRQNHHPGNYGRLPVPSEPVELVAKAQSENMPETPQPSRLSSADPAVRWYVAHTRPRCEKKLFDYCRREQIAATLPCYTSAHKYRGKTVAFEKPLFPGYVFLHTSVKKKALVRQNEYLANLLEVSDQETLENQLRDILLALASGMEVRLAPAIEEGARVRIKAGPLRGVEGWVEHRLGMDTVMLRLDFIGEAAAIRVGAEAVELA